MGAVPARVERLNQPVTPPPSKPYRPRPVRPSWPKKQSRTRRNPLNLRQFLVQAALLLLLACPARAQPDLPALRHLYAEAVQTEPAALRLLAATRGYDGPSAAVVGYHALAEAVRARYLWNPLAKLRAVREARRLFGRAVALDPQNVEVRFLRYSVEANVPRYLGLSDHLADDRAAVLGGARQYPRLGLDPQSLQLIRDFMLRYGDCSPEEARMLRAIAP